MLLTNALLFGSRSPDLIRQNKDYDNKDDSERERVDKLLDILNWIAQCFVVGEKGDVVSNSIGSLTRGKYC